MASLGFPCCLLADFSMACFLQSKLLALALCLCAFLSLSLSFRCGRRAALGPLFSLLFLQLLQIAVDVHFFYLTTLLLDAFPLACQPSSRRPASRPPRIALSS